jgi:hypothetical protein
MCDLMKVKMFGVGTEKSGFSLLGIGATRGGVAELEMDINEFIKDKKVTDIKLVAATSSNYQNQGVHTLICALVVYDETAKLAADNEFPTR